MLILAENVMLYLENGNLQNIIAKKKKKTNEQEFALNFIKNLI